MSQRLKCRLGLHDWRKWSEVDNHPSHPGKLDVQTRTCSFCGLSQRRLVPLEGFAVNKLPVKIGEDSDE